MTPPIVQACLNSPAVTALLGAGTTMRLYSFGEAEGGRGQAICCLADRQR